MLINKLFIANRGEIACRIMRSCRRLGVDVAVGYSDADAGARHVRLAPQSVRLGPAPSSQSYLNQRVIINAALQLGCDAIHPGYGFLSENAEFAAAVEAAGLIFVGPAAQTIAQMGDKSRAKAAMIAADVTTVPGSSAASEDPEVIAKWVHQVGCPAILKPAAGGGGKGMVVLAAPPTDEEIASAIRTARASFGHGALLVERFIQSPRHVEVQVFGDGRGNVVHLFDRDCSLQRRHQKVIEEAPAVKVPKYLRDQMIAAAVRGAQALKYRNAGTFEFIVDDQGYYFLEVNTRLQVEHPVTEEVTGIDLVDWQLRIASNEGLPLTQADISCRGHAIEARVYAEDPEDNFRPSSGRITAMDLHQSARWELGVETGSFVSPFYDPMIAKMIVSGPDRENALKKLRLVASQSAIFGVANNLGFVKNLCELPDVVAGKVHTGLIDQVPGRIPKATFPKDGPIAVAGLAEMLRRTTRGSATEAPWTKPSISGWGDRGLLDPSAPLGQLAIFSDGKRHVIRLVDLSEGRATVELENEVRFQLTIDTEGAVSSGVCLGHVWRAHCGAKSIEVSVDCQRHTFSLTPEFDREEHSPICKSPLPGVVSALSIVAGDRVSSGDVLVVIEAMKLENAVQAPLPGRVSEVHCEVGQQVTASQVLVELIPDE